MSSITSPLPDSAFKAEVSVAAPPATLRAGQPQTVSVRVRNASDTAWAARGRADGIYQINVGNKWLDAKSNKTVVNDDGRSGLPRDLKPGEEAEVPLKITAPKTPGEYVLVVDLAQEGVAWFGLKGSKTAQAKVRVEP